MRAVPLNLFEYFIKCDCCHLIHYIILRLMVDTICIFYPCLVFLVITSLKFKHLPIAFTGRNWNTNTIHAILLENTATIQKRAWRHHTRTTTQILVTRHLTLQLHRYVRHAFQHSSYTRDACHVPPRIAERVTLDRRVCRLARSRSWTGNWYWLWGL